MKTTTTMAMMIIMKMTIMVMTRTRTTTVAMKLMTMATHLWSSPTPHRTEIPALRTQAVEQSRGTLTGRTLTMKNMTMFLLYTTVADWPIRVRPHQEILSRSGLWNLQQRTGVEFCSSWRTKHSLQRKTNNDNMQIIKTVETLTAHPPHRAQRAFQW